MPRTTQERWLIGAAVAAGGLLLAVLIDLLVRRPGIVIGTLLIAYLVTRPVSPLCYTINLLERYRSSAAHDLANFVIPVALLCALFAGTWANHENYGFAIAFAATFIQLYVIDRIVAVVIDRVAGYVRYRQTRQQPEVLIEETDVVDDDALDGEVVR